jgi:hypothetical protein
MARREQMNSIFVNPSTNGLGIARLKVQHLALVVTLGGAFNRDKLLTKANKFANLKVRHPALVAIPSGAFVWSR